MTRFLSLMLEREGYAVQAAHSAAEALQKVRQEAFDVVITDLRMPDGDGIKVLEAAQKSGSVGPFAASLEALIAIGHADQNKYDEAAKHAQLAADKARFPADKDIYRADVARMLALAGKKEEARKIWAELASRPESPVWGEAHVRLGELEAAIAAKN